MLTVRLPENMEHELDIISQQQRVTKSEIVGNISSKPLHSALTKSPSYSRSMLFRCFFKLKRV